MHLRLGLEVGDVDVRALLERVDAEQHRGLGVREPLAQALELEVSLDKRQLARARSCWIRNLLLRSQRGPDYSLQPTSLEPTRRGGRVWTEGSEKPSSVAQLLQELPACRSIFVSKGGRCCEADASVRRTPCPGDRRTRRNMSAEGKSGRAEASEKGRRNAGESTGEQKPPSPQNRGLEVNWQAVTLDEVTLEDRTVQYRLSTQTTDLARSLGEDGQEEPIDLLRGFGKPYRVIDGFRRCQAAYELGWPSIKAFIHDMDEEKALRFAYTKNVVRRNLSPMERAHALWVGQKKGLSKSDLAAAFGISEKQVDRYLKLLHFSPALQRCIDRKVVTMAHAAVLADFEVEDPAAWKKRIEEERLDARALRRLLRRENGQHEVGRKRLYLKQTKDTLRMYPFSVKADTPAPERKKIATLLREAVQFLEEGG